MAATTRARIARDSLPGSSPFRSGLNGEVGRNAQRSAKRILEESLEPVQGPEYAMGTRMRQPLAARVNMGLLKRNPALEIKGKLKHFAESLLW